MGILDDAIRQHLELKRQHGAENVDLERLEKEAFGPATRPGDPEYADPDAEVAEEASLAAVPVPLERPAPDAGESSDVEIPNWLGSEEETTVQPMATEPEAAETEAASPESEPLVAEPAEPNSAGQARVEHAGLGDTADHPAPPAEPVQLGPEDEAEPTAAEMPPPTPASVDPDTGGESIQDSSATEPPDPPERDIFDGDEFDFGDLDLGLDDDEDAAPAPEPPAVATPTTTDHDLPPAPIEPRPAPEAAPPPSEEPNAEEPPSPPPSEEPSAEEDLLEETPDFLQDAPEGEDLWFEQGPPKDFDFDDD